MSRSRKWRRGPAMTKRKKSAGGPLKAFSQRQQDRAPSDVTVRFVDPKTLRR